MIIGTFNYDNAADCYHGQIQTLSLHRESVVFRPQTRGNDREPDYRVFSKCGEGEVELGAAWQRRSDRDQDYLSVLLDDPALDRSLSAALFPERDGKANLVWSRPAPRQQPANTRELPSARGRMKPSLRGPTQG